MNRSLDVQAVKVVAMHEENNDEDDLHGPLPQQCDKDANRNVRPPPIRLPLRSRLPRKLHPGLTLVMSAFPMVLNDRALPSSKRVCSTFRNWHDKAELPLRLAVFRS